MDAAPAPGRVVLLVTSPRLPAGLLPWPTWQALHTADVVLLPPDHRQVPALRAAAVRGLHPMSYAAADAASWAAAAVVAGIERAAAGQAVVVLLDAAGERGSPEVEARARELAGAAGVEVGVLLGAVDPPGARLLDVMAVMDRLRSPGGCPWDAEQTHASLARYLVEECYELLEAVEEVAAGAPGARAALREELGDVLLQVAFHARLAQEVAPAFDLDDVAADLVDKLVRRHPHVFAAAPDGAAPDAPALAASWEALKKAEKQRVSVTQGVPLGQPALTLAATLQRRAARLGAPTGAPAGTGLSASWGEQLWTLVEQARAAGVDPEQALRDVARAFRDALAAAEAQALAEGLDPASLGAQEWRTRAAWLPEGSTPAR